MLKLNIHLIQYIIYYLADDYTPILRYVSKDWKYIIDNTLTFYKKHVYTILHLYSWFKSIKEYPDVILWTLERHYGSFYEKDLYHVLMDVNHWKILQIMFFYDYRVKDRKFWFHIYDAGMYALLNQKRVGALWCFYKLKSAKEITAEELNVFVSMAFYHDNYPVIHYDKKNELMKFWKK